MPGALRCTPCLHSEVLMNTPRTLGQYFRNSPWTRSKTTPTAEEILSDDIWTVTLRAQGTRPMTLAVVPDENGCLIWQGATNGSGHAMYNGPAYRHYIVYFYGPIPPGYEVHHTCGNGRCVNPLHLQILTRAQHHEATRRSGQKYGAKLTARQAAEVKRMALAGEAHKDVAAEFGISTPLVSMIKNGHRWADINPADALEEWSRLEPTKPMTIQAAA